MLIISNFVHYSERYAEISYDVLVTFANAKRVRLLLLISALGGSLVPRPLELDVGIHLEIHCDVTCQGDRDA